MMNDELPSFVHCRQPPHGLPSWAAVTGRVAVTESRSAQPRRSVAGRPRMPRPLRAPVTPSNVATTGMTVATVTRGMIGRRFVAR